MQKIGKIAENVYWIGANERRQPLFENIYPVPQGYSCNAYVVLDRETVLLDTIDADLGDLFLEKLETVLEGRELDYIIVNHMEPDHCALLARTAKKYPNVQLIGNAKTAAMAGQFFGEDVQRRFRVIKEGDSLCTGDHTFRFYMAPMVHWPEAMVTYEEHDRILYSADAFGTFGTLDGLLFADQTPFDWEAARIYYTNIVGKYGPQVKALLNKAAGLDIAMLCPLHGPIWRQDLGSFIEKYLLWAGYTPEEQGVVVACASIYGHTEAAAEQLAFLLGERGVKNIRLYDLSRTPVSTVLAEIFRYSHVVLASSTYNNGLFTPMEVLLHDLRTHNMQGRTVAVIENGSWAPVSGKLIREGLAAMKNMTVLEPGLSLRSALAEGQDAQLEAMADAIAASMGLCAAAETPSEAPAPAGERYVCDICGYVYDPAQGDPEHGVAPGTAWADVPADYRCPLCRMPKEKFSKAE